MRGPYQRTQYSVRETPETSASFIRRFDHNGYEILGAGQNEIQLSKAGDQIAANLVQRRSGRRDGRGLSCRTSAHQTEGRDLPDLSTNENIALFTEARAASRIKHLNRRADFAGNVPRTCR